MKILRSFGFAWHGLKYAFATQANFRIHLLLALLAILLGIGLRINALEWLFVSVCIAMVLFAELINTAIEKLADVVHKDHHPEIKLVKDISAGAVLVIAVISIITGIVIFLPKIISLIRSI